ncbi:aminoglycoside phosphotransferase family protein [Streptomyces sp. NBS 14/10]|nr:phosphotransferase [Streptomyces sp. NBS 14/10]KAK1186360.1 aminoglycoside phosphotransferase family protein [Streptomyces sp. NBS 14/10]
MVDVVRHRSAPHQGPVGEAIVLADRRDATVIRHGSVVAKAHAPGTDPDELTIRVRVAGHPSCAGILLPPLGGPEALPGGRAVTLWPYGEPVSPEHPEAAPWAEAGALLARLHSVQPAALPGPLPPMRGPAKAARAVARLRRAGAGATGVGAAGAVEAVLRAWGALPGWARGEGAAPRGGGALCHGDLHLGQLVRCAGPPEYPGLPEHPGPPEHSGPPEQSGCPEHSGPSEQPGSPEHPQSPEHPNPSGTLARWLLIDVDDLGLGDPAWDLARPAAWFAAGLLAPDDWERFLGAYRTAGGPAAGERQEDPWARLDVPARALTVQISALALAKAAREGRPLDEAEESMVEACLRIARLAGQ